VLVTSIVLLVLSLGSFATGVAVARRDVPPGFDDVLRTARELRARAARPVSNEVLARAAIRGMLRALGDRYAVLLGPEGTRSVDSLISGRAVGIGVWLQPAAEGLTVSAVVPRSPAADAGLRSDDLLVSVDGHDVTGARGSDVPGLLRGPDGSRVSVDVRRGDRILHFSLLRARITVATVDSRMLPGDIGLVHVFEFASGTADSIRSQVRSLVADGARGIVIDLRQNPGGLASEAFATASVFIDGGLIATIKQRGTPDQRIYADGDALRPFPMVVLVDGGTASSSELVSGALQDRGRATIVGERTFGKGSVLSVESLGSGDDITFTTALFFTPAGHPVEGRGITPDIAVAGAVDGDPQLDAAVDAVLGGG
jgi:carboxyl-terminal processing protease